MADLAAKVSVLSGGGKLFATGRSTGPLFRGTKGFVSNEVAAAILGWPLFEVGKKYDFEINTGAEGFLINGKLKIYGADEVVAVLERKAYAQNNFKSLEPAVKVALDLFMRDLTLKLQEEAEAIAQRMVYETPPKIVRTIEPSGNKRLKDWQTGELMRAVRAGIVYHDFQLTVGVDESLAPYWLFVEHGHRVVLPNGVDIGTWVFGRPFFEAIKERATEMIEDAMVQLNRELDDVGEYLIEYIAQRQGTGFTPKTPL